VWLDWLNWLCEGKRSSSKLGSGKARQGRQAGRQDPVGIRDGEGEGDPFMNRSA
jgi:hypothetical protein